MYCDIGCILSLIIVCYGLWCRLIGNCCITCCTRCSRTAGSASVNAYILKVCYSCRFVCKVLSQTKLSSTVKYFRTWRCRSGWGVQFRSLTHLIVVYRYISRLFSLILKYNDILTRIQCTCKRSTVCQVRLGIFKVRYSCKSRRRCNTICRSKCMC